MTPLGAGRFEFSLVRGSGEGWSEVVERPFDDYKPVESGRVWPTPKRGGAETVARQQPGSP